MAGSVTGHFEEYSKRWPASVTKVGLRHKSENVMKKVYYLQGWAG